ncbi:hypothetical protein DW228_18540 [Bacteroides fragilis]|uniref:Transmembrane protein n=1 Tax=Bacteroides fragilis TaxID=817 RepID=A0A396BSN0_BACFG|nr:hypothetical protein [Bacteroides fragilis]RHH07932.1 hypothetical protein DW228_18540 [Bacteroides fragilis]
MEIDLRNALQNDALFKFYSWMKLSVFALYIDMVMGFIFQGDDLDMKTQIANLEFSQIICFVLLGAVMFPILTCFVYMAHGLALMIKGLSFEVREYFASSKNFSVTTKKKDYFEIHYDELKDYALRNNNQVAYLLAVDCEKSYALERLNRYITVAALILFCFDINIGSIISHIIIWSPWGRIMVYILASIAIYFLLRELAMYNDGHCLTRSEALYNEVWKMRSE